MSPGWSLEDYEPVEARLARFWAEHPDGQIRTKMVHVGPDGYIVKAWVWRKRDGGPFSATGYAQEAVTDRGVNSTSALENCETSAIGRALANLGYAAKGKRPSREEMSRILEPQTLTARTAPQMSTGTTEAPASPQQDPPSRVAPSKPAPVASPAPVVEQHGSDGAGLNTSGEVASGDGQREGSDLAASPDPIATHKDWARAARALKTTQTQTQVQVVEFLKMAGSAKQPSEVTLGMLDWALSSIAIAKRTEVPK